MPVRSSVRPFVTLFLGNHSLLFSETLLFVRASKRKKNVPSAFLKKIPFLAKNAQNGGFSHFFAIHSLEFANFCTKPSIQSRKMAFSYFLGKFKNGPYCSKLTQIWPKVGQNHQKLRFAIFPISLREKQLEVERPSKTTFFISVEIWLV